MKKLLRLIIKIIGTPIVVPWMLIMIGMGYCAIFVDWLYDKDEYDKMITKDTHKYFTSILKNWFTTI